VRSSGFVRAIALASLACLSGTAGAYQIYTVTRTDDPAPNGCQIGDCSLREAVLAANGNAGLDDVVLGAATYVLSATIEVEDEVRIMGAVAGGTQVIAASGVDPLFHLDEITPPTLVLRYLSMDALGGNEVDGISSATLVLDHVAMPNPEGGIFLDYAADGGIINVDDSNVAGLFGFYGSRVAWINNSRFGQLALLQTGAASNQMGLYRVIVDGAARDNSSLRVASVGEVSLDQVTVQNTRYGLYIDELPASLIVDGLHYLHNLRPMKVVSGADFTIAHSEFRDNQPIESNEPDEPAALWIPNGGSHVVVADSTFAYNTGTSDTGGAVLVENGAELSLRNTTFYNNSFAVNAAAAGARGGAVGYRSATNDTVLTLQNVTIVAPPYSPLGMEGSAFGGRGGGADVSLNIYNSVFVGTCRSDSPTPDYAIGNVKTSGDNCGFGSGGNLLGVSRDDVGLGALGDHGGPTATSIPAPGSVIIDAGVSLGCLAADQRGLPRPSGAHCDAGAIEVGDSIFANGFD
jgi:CSLREA domain-containing protein